MEDKSAKTVAGGWAEELVCPDLMENGQYRVFVLAQTFPGLEELRRRDRQGWVDVSRDVEGFHMRCDESTVEFQMGT